MGRMRVESGGDAASRRAGHLEKPALSLSISSKRQAQEDVIIFIMPENIIHSTSTINIFNVL